MRPENQRMQDFLARHGINCHVKYIPDGSMKRTWRLYGKGQKWTDLLREKLTQLDFLDFDFKPLSQYSGNGGSFCVFVRGHNELV
jgi:hypothetical protein